MTGISGTDLSLYVVHVQTQYLKTTGDERIRLFEARNVSVWYSKFTSSHKLRILKSSVRCNREFCFCGIRRCVLPLLLHEESATAPLKMKALHSLEASGKTNQATRRHIQDDWVNCLIFQRHIQGLIVCKLVTVCPGHI